MNNLSEEIIAKFLMGKCTEEELIQVNLWIKESDENARKLFRMEEIYHLGKEKHTVSPKRMDQAERSLYKRLAIEEAKQAGIRCGSSLWGNNIELSVKDSDVNEININNGTLELENTKNRGLIFDSATKVKTDGKSTIKADKDSEYDIK